jgi:hypothetical protein
LVLATALQFTFGWGPLVWLHHALPVQIDFPKIRIIVLADFALAMLAGFGVAVLTTPGRTVPRWLIAVTALTVAAVQSLLIWLPDAGPLIDDAADRFTGPRSIFQGTPFAIALVMATALVLAWLLVKRGARTSPVVLCALVAVDMLTFAWGHVPFSRTDALLATPPAIRFLQERVDASSRILATRNTIPYNWEAQYRLATPAGYLYLTRLAVDVMTPITGGADPGIIELRQDLLIRQRSPLIDFLGVRYIVAGRGSGAEFAQHPDRFVPVYDDGSVQIFENPRALPRAHLVPCDGIEIQEFQRRAISRANHAFKAVRVDPGQHLVRFVFDPWTFRWGATVTIVGLGIVGGLLGWSAWGRRKQRAGPGR